MFGWKIYLQKVFEGSFGADILKWKCVGMSRCIRLICKLRAYTMCIWIKVVTRIYSHSSLSFKDKWLYFLNVVMFMLKEVEIVIALFIVLISIALIFNARKFVNSRMKCEDENKVVSGMKWIGYWLCVIALVYIYYKLRI